jgi:hypothetical protein
MTLSAGDRADDEPDHQHDSEDPHVQPPFIAGGRSDRLASGAAGVATRVLAIGATPATS